MKQDLFWCQHYRECIGQCHLPPGGERFGKNRRFQRGLHRRQRSIRQGAYRASNYMVDSLLSLLGQAKSVI